MNHVKILATHRLLDVASHIAVQHHPQFEWAVQSLDILQRVGVRNLDLDAEILLLVYVDRFGEPEGGQRRRFAVGRKIAFLRIWPGAGSEEPGRHRYHRLFADDEACHRVVYEFADDRARAVIRVELFYWGSALAEFLDQLLDVLQGELD